MTGVSMTKSKPMEDASQDFVADLAALRDDVESMRAAITEFIRSQTTATSKSAGGTVDTARQTLSDTANKVSDRAANASSDLKAAIERNPLAAVFFAMAAGLVVGLLSGGRK
jgi:ElaB/YqjD/DUF883 family membrane-anchored ribosome-binding protein